MNSNTPLTLPPGSSLLTLRNQLSGEITFAGLQSLCDWLGIPVSEFTSHGIGPASESEWYEISAQIAHPCAFRVLPAPLT